MIIGEIESEGSPDDFMFGIRIKHGVVGLRFVPKITALPWRIRRKDLVTVLETIGGLTIIDGPREVRSAYVSKEGFTTGWFHMLMSKPEDESD